MRFPTFSHIHLRHSRVVVAFAASSLFLIVPALAAQVVNSSQIPKTASAPSLTDAGHVHFEVVSIRPSKSGSPQMETLETQADGYRASNQTLVATIAIAYLPHTTSATADSAPLKMPSWATEEYDIQAKVAPEDMQAWQNQGQQQELLRAMLQAMLEDKCKLVVHWVPGKTSGFALMLGKHGTTIKKASAGKPVPPPGYPSALSDGIPVRLGSIFIPGAIYYPFYKHDKRTSLPFYNVSLKTMAGWLSDSLGVPIVDGTGLAGNFDIDLPKLSSQGRTESDPGPSMKWDLGALGLKLVPTKLPMQRLMIDHIERPSME
jgi:uncharacterized protein (TIGR03435 family)